MAAEYAPGNFRQTRGAGLRKATGSERKGESLKAGGSSARFSGHERETIAFFRGSFRSLQIYKSWSNASPGRRSFQMLMNVRGVITDVYFQRFLGKWSVLPVTR